MISKYELKKLLEKSDIYTVDSDTEEIKYNNLTVCTLDQLIQKMREEEHCDFESIYYEHATLTDIFRCRQCGTVIFGGDDVQRYDPDCRCPVCCHDDSVCHNNYWSGEDIAADPEKQKYIDALISMQEEMDLAEERRRHRNGLFDWEIWKKQIYGKKHFFEFSLECSNLFHTGLKGLNFKIMYGEKDIDGLYIYKKSFRIPLSLYAIYIQWIVPKIYKI